MRRAPRCARIAAGLLAILLAACGSERDAPGAEPPALTYARDARFRVAKQLERRRAQAYHPSDGNGRAWLVAPEGGSGPATLRAGSRARFEIVYEAGPEGVAAGGSVSLHVPTKLGWDAPQVDDPAGPGFTRFEVDAEGVELVALARPTVSRLDLHVRGRALAAGQRIRFVYGDGPARARVDRVAERGERLWIAVDGDGDRVRRLVDDSPSVDIVAGEPRRVAIALPSTARPGQPVRIHVAALDAVGNAGGPFSAARVRLLARPTGWGIPREVELSPADGGARAIEARAAAPGVFRLRAALLDADGNEVPGTRVASNPIEVADDPHRILWADLHGHSQLSDGTGTPEDYYRYARDVAGLDLAVLTDHDHWGIQPLDRSPEAWRRVASVAAAFHEPGRFLTLVGYEWTSWLQGHRHVLYFDDEGELLSANDPRYQTPPQLWEALRGRRALTFAHHSAGGSISTNWDFVPDPVLEPLTEIVSSQGSSESPDTPGLIRDAVPGNFVRDVLERGVRFGFVGSGDGHEGHPGLAQLFYRRGGLAAIGAERLERGAVLEAMRARRVYATNGPRIALFVSLDGRAMGSEVPPPPGAAHALALRVRAQAPIERIDLVRKGGELETLPGKGRLDWELSHEVPPLGPGGYLYLRVVQVDGGAAWSSPFYGAAPRP